MKTRLSLCLLAAGAIAFPAAASEWTPIRKDGGASLSIDAKSVVRKGDEASFRYLVEFPTPQGNPSAGVIYRSLVVSASLRCKPRTFAIGKTEAYLEPGATGRPLATTRAPAGPTQFEPVQAGSSDEDLWRRICEGAKPASKTNPRSRP